MSAEQYIQAMQGRIEGRVQGVSFRASMRQQAQQCGVAGWVCNRPDGSVEFMVQGDRRAVRQILDWARRGPPGASVNACNVHEMQPDRHLTDFHIRT
jgi:acylphosphatase